MADEPMSGSRLSSVTGAVTVKAESTGGEV